MTYKANHPLNKGSFLLRLCSLTVIFAMFLSLSLVMNHRWFGTAPGTPAAEVPETVTHTDDGTIIINTTTPGKEITGYAGNTPLEITVKNGKVATIQVLENEETPSFLDRATAHLFPQWTGKSVPDALNVKPDACTGATYSSEAIIANMRLGLEACTASNTTSVTQDAPTRSAPWWCVIIVSLTAAILPFFIHNKTYRIIQLTLNVGVLGFWTGTFLSYTVLISLLSNAFRPSLLPVWILVFIAFILPLLGKGNRYCLWVCPLGSLQQLAGIPVRHKPKLPHSLVSTLIWIRKILWGVLVALLWAGVGTEWIDYELFTAFMIGSAPAITLYVAVSFIILSFIIDRPFCRFVCPMGCAIDMAHNDR